MRRGSRMPSRAVSSHARSSRSSAVCSRLPFAWGHSAPSRHAAVRVPCHRPHALVTCTPWFSSSLIADIQHCVNPRTKFLVRASYLQIYNEVISDLLKPERTNLQIHEDKKKGVFVENLSEWVVTSPSEVSQKARPRPPRLLPTALVLFPPFSSREGTISRAPHPLPSARIPTSPHPAAAPRSMG